MRIFLCAILLVFPFVMKTESDVSTAFRHVKVEGNNGYYRINGEVRSLNEVFYYSVEDGHVVFTEGNKVVPKGKTFNWKPFNIQIQIPANKLPDNGTFILSLYERSIDGQISHSYPIVLERFNKKSLNGLREQAKSDCSCEAYSPKRFPW